MRHQVEMSAAESFSDKPLPEAQGAAWPGSSKPSLPPDPGPERRSVSPGLIVTVLQALKTWPVHPDSGRLKDEHSQSRGGL